MLIQAGLHFTTETPPVGPWKPVKPVSSVTHMLLAHLTLFNVQLAKRIYMPIRPACNSYIAIASVSSSRLHATLAQPGTLNRGTMRPWPTVRREREGLQTDQPIADLVCSVQIYGLNKDPRLPVPDYHRKPKGWWSNPRKARPQPRTLLCPAACFCCSVPPLMGMFGAGADDQCE